MDIYFRVDGSTNMGLGHLIRCLALAEYLRSWYKCTFLIRGNDSKINQYVRRYGFNIFELTDTTPHLDEALEVAKQVGKSNCLIVDGYHFTKDYLKTLKSTVGLLVQFDDLNQGHFISDIVINQNIHAESEDYNFDPLMTTILKGVKYSVVRKEFELPFDNWERKGIFVCLGGADHKNVTKKVYVALRQIFFGQITLVLGPAFIYKDEFNKITDPHLTILENLNAGEMVKEFSKHEFCICTASVISLEACSIGIKLIVGYTEENQRKIAYAIEDQGIGSNVESLYDQSSDELALRFKKILTKDFSDVLKHQTTLFDHHSKERILGHIIKAWFRRHPILSERFIIRVLAIQDVSQNYLSWFEDSSVRKHIETSIEMDAIDKVQNYVSEKYLNHNSLMLGIFTPEGEHIGNIKYEPLDLEKKVAVMGILIGSPLWRGKGVGPEVILASTKALNKKGISKIYLGVGNDNLDAIRAYEKIGFKKTRNEYIPINVNAIEMLLQL